MKKTLCLVLALLLTVGMGCSLVSCGHKKAPASEAASSASAGSAGAAPEQTDKPAEKPEEPGTSGVTGNTASFPGRSGSDASDLEAYRSVLNPFYQSLIDDWDEEKLTEKGLNYYYLYSLRNMKESGVSGDKHYVDLTGYLFLDLDADGQDELLLGLLDPVTANGAGSFFDIYTIRDGVPVSAVRGAERNFYWLGKSGILYNYGSNGAASQVASASKFDTDQPGFLKVTELLYSFDDIDANRIVWQYFDHDIEDALRNEVVEEAVITEQKATDLVKTWQTDKAALLFTPFRSYKKTAKTSDTATVPTSPFHLTIYSDPNKNDYRSLGKQIVKLNTAKESQPDGTDMRFVCDADDVTVTLEQVSWDETVNDFVVKRTIFSTAVEKNIVYQFNAFEGDIPSYRLIASNSAYRVEWPVTPDMRDGETTFRLTAEKTE